MLLQRLDVGVLRGVAGAHRAALAGRDLVEGACAAGGASSARRKQACPAARSPGSRRRRRRASSGAPPRARRRGLRARAAPARTRPARPCTTTWLPLALATTPSRRSSWARFWSYWPKTRLARRLSSKVRVISAVSSTPGGRLDGGCRASPRAVALSAGLKSRSPLHAAASARPASASSPNRLFEPARDDPHRHDLADQAPPAVDLHRLQIGRLARRAGRDGGPASRTARRRVAPDRGRG